MKNTRPINILLAIVLMINVFAFSGCGEKMPEYGSIVSAIDTYRDNYSEYRKDNDHEMISCSIEETARRDNTPCSSYYLSSPDGKYCSVTLEYEVDNVMTVDEYYYLTDKAFFIVSSYIDEGSMTPVVTEYYVWKGTMYRIDKGSSSLAAVDDGISAQYYLSFEDLVNKYGPQQR